ncbi:ATP-dependent DNA helicase RecG [Coxiella endosymbiont of Amblyomma americanum]|uniref:ATP-dependent DNA helicase RecG n=1 Tax=Coxiella endosymbiont of Amblyomma americanum TaxID=325775 RepID=UPI00068C0476|nr:ATP-dependent DNA helicase RecG [Coxiella endosymbiont of Amblyomma americanum]AUJ58804.1 DNA helicase RecG [Coxiella-like endosymbiont of Amblyomma americanum]
MLDNIPVSSLRGVGPITNGLLDNLNIRSLQDLLLHLPLRYENRAQLTALGALQNGKKTAVEGFVKFTSTNHGKKRNFSCLIEDETGCLTLRFYYVNSRQYQKLIRSGSRIRCFGTVYKNFQNQLEMVHPEYQAINDTTASSPITEYFTPVYSTTKGLSQVKLRDLLSQALNYLKNRDALEELFSGSLRKNFHLLTLADSLTYIHCPPLNAPLRLLEIGRHPAQQRLVIEELTAQQISLLKLRIQTKKYVAPLITLETDGQKKLRQLLPFNLTASQERVVSEINKDLKQLCPMKRVIQGDVGTGKTIIAAMTIIKIVENGYQCALMAPTEVLVEQHYRSLQRWLSPLGIRVGYLTGSLNNLTRRRVLHKIRYGEDQVIVGTHTLFQKKVIFHKLGLIVIDEQHRFGVHQQLTFQEKSNDSISAYSHQLIMTATPIPRTLALTICTHLDVSIMNELPSERQSVTTILVSNERRDEVIARIKQHCKQGRQAYWVCTLIKDSAAIPQCQSAETTYQKLKKQLIHLTVGLIHGRLSKQEKSIVIADVKSGKIDLLIATMVIEVGIDIPNVSLIVIENAERLGTAQIHQLRGRVGRGKDKSYCVLLYKKPLSQCAKKRLVLLRSEKNGFSIAKKDFKLRGPGELLGERQSGPSRLRVADLRRDQYLLTLVQRIAKQMLTQYPLYVTKLLKRWC